MKIKENAGFLSAGASWIFTIAQTNEIFQCVMLVLSILSTLFTLAYTLSRWYNKAKEDGKITPEEIEELQEDIKDVFKDKEEK